MVEFAHMYLSVTTSLSHNFVGVHLDENERNAAKTRTKEDSLLYKQVLYPYSCNPMHYELRTLKPEYTMMYMIIFDCAF